MSGLSLGVALLDDGIWNTFQKKSDHIKWPVKVSAITEKDSVALVDKGGGLWENQGMIVRLKRRKESVAVEIAAPDKRLLQVVLEWDVPLKRGSQVLNDHWERTYGDVSWHAPVQAEKLPWYFLEFDGRLTNGFGVRTGGAAFCYWTVAGDRVNLTIDTRSGGSGVALGNRILPAAEIVVMRGQEGDTPFESQRRFCKKMCSKARMPKKPVYGINDWYFAYGNNSEQLILEHTKLLADAADGLKNRPFSVIDAGWFQPSSRLPEDSSWGDDMETPNAKFGDMARVADKIRRAGMRPGIWTRPLCASVHDSKNLILPIITGREDTRQPVLDPSIPENLERIKGYFHRYQAWGYDLVKFDYTSYDLLGQWGFQMTQHMTQGPWSMYDKGRTTAEIIRDMYQAIRQAAGDMYLIGCNTFSHLAAGLFELNRIGDDTSGKEWARTRKMGVNTLAFRAAHHGTFYAADADCVGLTPQVPWEKNKKWMQLVAESGTPLFISAQPEAVGAEQKAFIKTCFELASKELPVGEPLDWLAGPVPQQWKLNGQIRHFNWS